MICQWERYKATRAPMPSQQRQIETCRCTPCSNARTLNAAKFDKSFVVKAETAERVGVLAWKPEPPRGPEIEV